MPIPLSFIGRELGNRKRINGPGRLTVARINSIQNFFGLAIRRNKGDTDEMACMKSLPAKNRMCYRNNMCPKLR